MTLSPEQRRLLTERFADLLKPAEDDPHNAMYIAGLLSTALVRVLDHVPLIQARNMVINDVRARLDAAIQQAPEAH